MAEIEPQLKERLSNVYGNTYIQDKIARVQGVIDNPTKIYGRNYLNHIPDNDLISEEKRIIQVRRFAVDNLKSNVLPYLHTLNKRFIQIEIETVNGLVKDTEEGYLEASSLERSITLLENKAAQSYTSSWAEKNKNASYPKNFVAPEAVRNLANVDPSRSKFEEKQPEQIIHALTPQDLEIQETPPPAETSPEIATEVVASTEPDQVEEDHDIPPVDTPTTPVEIEPVVIDQTEIEYIPATSLDVDHPAIQQLPPTVQFIAIVLHGDILANIPPTLGDLMDTVQSAERSLPQDQVETTTKEYIEQLNEAIADQDLRIRLEDEEIAEQEDRYPEIYVEKKAPTVKQI
jgi:hypothetical protein